MKWKIATATLLVLFLATLAVIFAYLHIYRSEYGLESVNRTAIVTQVKQLNQLATVKYNIQRVVGLTEPRQPLGQESILLMVQGEVIAGIDLAALTPDDISPSGDRTITIELPRPEILNVFLDEKQTKVWDRQITWWTPWVSPDPDLEHKARMSALNDVRSAAMEMGILEQARQNAESGIRCLLEPFGIHVQFKPRST